MITYDEMLNCFKIQILKPKGENWAVFGTFGSSFPKLRNIVLRHFEDNKIVFYTHSKSQKVEEILKDSRSSICWYSKKHSIQIQFYGRTTMSDSEIYIKRVHDFRDYMGPKPGQDYLSIDDKTVHFCALEFLIEKVTALKLSKNGHIKFEKCLLTNQTKRVIP